MGKIKWYTLGDRLAKATHHYTFEKEVYESIDKDELAKVGEIVDIFEWGGLMVIEMRKACEVLKNHPKLLDHFLGDVD